MTCEMCDLVKSRKGIVYEDDTFAAFLHPSPATPGHIILLPKAHITILEQASDDIVGELFDKASKISMALFENGNEGTNIIVNNGDAAGQKVPHLVVHIIPRNTDDGLNLAWTVKQLDEENMSNVQKGLSDALNAPDIPVTKEEFPEEEKVEEVDEEVPNYLKRLP